MLGKCSVCPINYFGLNSYHLFAKMIDDPPSAVIIFLKEWYSTSWPAIRQLPPPVALAIYDGCLNEIGACIQVSPGDVYRCSIVWLYKYISSIASPRVNDPGHLRLYD